mgnify:CR=1 FL=1
MTATHVILLCGGSGQRMAAGKNKVLLSLCGKSVVRRSAEAFAGFADDMVVVCREPDREAIEAEIKSIPLPFPVAFVSGGATRQASVSQGLAFLSGVPAEDFVLVHDAASCLVDEDTIRRVIESTEKYGCGIPAVPVRDTIRTAALHAGNLAGETLPRESLRAMQTPQGFRGKLLADAMSLAEASGFEGTDDASLLEFSGGSVYLTEGSFRNIKLTTQEDLIMAEAFLRNEALPALRVGQGYDVHRLGPDRKLILCGVEIPYEKGLIGHSDADVALHALMDALLGAAAMGDIGQHFPDSDDRFKGISSLLLLKETVRLLAEHGFAPSNVDLTIIAQKPKLAPYIPSMRKNVAEVLGLPENRVSVKATTTEHLGFEGRMEGISAQAVCLVLEK